MSAYKVVPNCTADDVVGIAANNMTAFYQETWWNLLWTHQKLDDIITAATLRSADKVLLVDRKIRRHQKVVHSATGEIVGYARWLMPESRSGEWLEAQTPDVSDEDKERYRASSAKADWNPHNPHGDMDVLDVWIHESMRKHEPKEPFIKLDYLCAKPTHQRQGVASMLVKSGIAAADKLGMDIFLVAMGKGALSMYTRLGFELLDETAQSLKPFGADEMYETFILVKHPAKE